MTKQLLTVALAGVFALGLAACGERPQVVNYKQGAYQGKPDSKPWENTQFNNSEEEWERAIRTRNQAQNVHLSILPRTPNAPACGNCGAPNGHAYEQ